jgi:adhesin transport system outer membrane protein
LQFGNEILGAVLRGHIKQGALFATLAFTLSACLGAPEATSGKLPFLGAGIANPFKANNKSEEIKAAAPAGAFEQQDVGAADKEYSQIIETLQSRKSVLAPGSAYGRVAASVTAASSRASEAELRSARLRAVAASKNWLPTLGPSISLTSLGDFVASLIVEQVLFDNGRKKAERAFARADVEVAAVTLSQDVNDRVYEALVLYITAQKAQEKSALAERGVIQMREYHRIIEGRVNGGIADRTQLSVVSAKLSEMEADARLQKETASTAMAELNTMAAGGVEGLSGAESITVPRLGSGALSVILAEAEAGRAVAQSRMDRAGLLPSVSASGDLASGKAGIKAGGAGLGFNTGDNLRAVTAQEEAASLRVGEAVEASNRRAARLEQKVSSSARQEADARGLAAQSAENLRLFERQFQAGKRRVLELVSMYETVIDQSRAQIDLKYDVPLTQLEIAKEMGVLVDGAKI